MRVLHDVGDNGLEQITDLSRLEILSRLSLRLAAGEEVPELVHDIRRLVEARSVMLHLYEPRTNRLYCAPHHNTLGEEAYCDIGIGIIGRAALYQEAVCLPGVSGSQPTDNAVVQIPILALPILGPHAELLGVLSAEGLENSSFADRDISVMASLAVQVGAALVHQTVVTDLSKKQRELEFLNRLLIEVGVARSAHEVIDVLTKHACVEVGAESAAVLVVVRDRPSMFTRSQSGKFLDRFERRDRVESGLLTWVHAKGLPAIIDDPGEDPRCKPDWLPAGQAASAVMAVPITAARRVLGGLEVRRPRVATQPGFSNDDLRVLSLLAGHASRALTLIEEREHQEDVQRLATLGRALSGVAHDIRSPLTIISANTELLASNPSEVESRSKSILSAIDEVNELINGLIALAGGRGQVFRQAIDLATLEPIFRERLERACQSRKVALTIKVGTGSADLDLMRVKRIVHNLGRNAVDAMSQGGSLVIDVRTAPDLVTITVTDSGHGLPEIVQRNLFQPFVTYAKDGGSGLGLYIVHRCVLELGGQIRVETSAGRGTTFTVDLPAQVKQEPS